MLISAYNLGPYTVLLLQFIILMKIEDFRSKSLFFKAFFLNVFSQCQTIFRLFITISGYNFNILQVMSPAFLRVIACKYNCRQS